MKCSAAETVRKFYAQFSGNDHVLVLINADPDAISSAIAVKRLLWRKVASVTLSNINIIKRPDNIAMIRLIKTQLIHISKIKADQYTRFVIVDSQPDHSELFQKFNFDVIIDHHPITESEAPFKDVRPEYGANASIMTEYLKAAKIKPSAKLATALFLGIKTDTHDFERQTLIEDIRAFQFLFRHANMHLVRRIELADLTPDFLKYFEIALRTRRIRKQKAFINLGKVQNPDICVIIADFFMRLNNVNWSIVSGYYKNNLVIIFRNDGIRKNAGKLAQQSFGAFGSAGGHKSMARAEIPVSNLEGTVKVQNDHAILLWVMRCIQKSTKRRKSKAQKTV
ncbi:DHH family phosphoesterase [Desulfococcaceae bacterium HSG9]|nr:DHH family phosphoesterase [Desulfococcaceae bacterium HSG9]